MMQGIWNSRLTMPMWLRTVPPVHTTPASSWYSGARKVAPASCTRATTPSAPVSMRASTSSGPSSTRSTPAHRRVLEHGGAASDLVHGLRR